MLQYALRYIYGQMSLGRADLLSNLIVKEGLDEAGETLIGGMHACTLCDRQRWLRPTLRLGHEEDGLLKASKGVGQCLRGCGQGGQRLIVRRRRRRFLLLFGAR